MPSESISIGFPKTPHREENKVGYNGYGSKQRSNRSERNG